MDDLSIAGPGSPVSLKKFLTHHPLNKPLTVLLDQTGTGIAQDEESMVYITPEECSKQALYYTKEIFNGKNIPEYLYRYIEYMMLERDFRTKESLIHAFELKLITETSEDYIHIKNLLLYCEHNTEMQQVLGLIQLIAGTLSAAKKEKAGVRVYIDRPETALHPKRQSRVMSMFHKLFEEYGDGLIINPSKNP